MGVPIIKMATVGILPSPLKILYYKLQGAKIGKGVSIGLLSILDCKDIQIGDGTRIGPLSFISCRKLSLGKRVKINMMVAIETDEVSIDNDSTLMEQVVVGGMLTPRSRLSIGKRVKVFPYSFLNPTEPIVIEDDVGIGGANYIFTHGSWQSVLDGFPVSFGPVTIKKGAWFPWRVFVMPNVVVGEYATIGAGSIITKSIPERSLAAGSPAKVLRTGNEYIKNYSVDEKNKIIHDILKEFTEFLNYKNRNDRAQLKVINKDVEITLEDGRKILYTNAYSQTSTAAYTISFNALSADDIKFLQSNKKYWFDLENKKSFYSKDKVWNEIKDFFSRYGVRFEIES